MSSLSFSFQQTHTIFFTFDDRIARLPLAAPVTMIKVFYKFQAQTRPLFLLCFFFVNRDFLFLFWKLFSEFRAQTKEFITLFSDSH